MTKDTEARLRWLEREKPELAARTLLPTDDPEYLTVWQAYRSDKESWRLQYLRSNATELYARTLLSRDDPFYLSPTKAYQAAKNKPTDIGPAECSAGLAKAKEAINVLTAAELLTIRTYLRDLL